MYLYLYAWWTHSLLILLVDNSCAIILHVLQCRQLSVLFLFLIFPPSKIANNDFQSLKIYDFKIFMFTRVNSLISEDRQYVISISENNPDPGRWGWEHCPPYCRQGGTSIPMLGAPGCYGMWPTASNKPWGLHSSRVSSSKK